MKTIKKNDLRLDKEVLTSLSDSDLSGVKGGLEPTGPLPVKSIDPCKVTEVWCRFTDIPEECLFTKANVCNTATL